MLEYENENLKVKNLDQERHIQRIASASKRKDGEIEELKRKAQDVKSKFEQMKKELSDINRSIGGTDAAIISDKYKTKRRNKKTKE